MYTEEELREMSKEDLISIVLECYDTIESLSEELNEY